MKVMVKTPLDTSSGYGSDGVGIIRALDRLGHDVRVYPVQMCPPIPLDAAKILTKGIEPPYDLLICHMDPMGMDTPRAEWAMTSRYIGWSMWEWEEFRPPKGRPGPKDFKRRNRGLDAFVSYDSVTAKALSPWLPKHAKHITLMGGFWSEDWPYQERDWDSGTFRFCMVGQLHDRKNPFAALQAFQHLKLVHGDEFDAELFLKTVPGSGVLLLPEWEDLYPWLRVSTRYWDHEQLLRLYRSSHCLLAPSTGEGKNLPALEMQSTGGVVIATDYSGHQNWLSDSFAYPLRWKPEDTGRGVSARPDVAHLADLMWHIYTHRDEAKQKGVLASKTVQAQHDWVPVMAKFMRFAESVPPRDITVEIG